MFLLYHLSSDNTCSQQYPTWLGIQPHLLITNALIRYDKGLKNSLLNTSEGQYTKQRYERAGTHKRGMINGSRQKNGEYLFIRRPFLVKTFIDDDDGRGFLRFQQWQSSGLLWHVVLILYHYVGGTCWLQIQCWSVEVLRTWWSGVRLETLANQSQGRWSVCHVPGDSLCPFFQDVSKRLPWNAQKETNISVHVVRTVLNLYYFPDDPVLKMMMMMIMAMTKKVMVVVERSKVIEHTYI